MIFKNKQKCCCGQRPLLNTDAKHIPCTTAKDGRRPLFNSGGRRAAFTLAEVLITLAIIGIVAALTMPTLIQNYQKSVTVNSLKKFYATMVQVKMLSETVNGNMEYWDFSDSETKEGREKIFDKYFRPFLNVTDECDADKGCINDLHSNIFAPHYILNNGTIFQFSPATNDRLGNFVFLLVDINGAKGPDELGRDVFALDIFVKEGVVMLGTLTEVLDDDGAVIDFRLSTRDELINGININNGRDIACCSKDSNCGGKDYLNINCGALIQMDGWKISPDYPW